MAMSLEPSVVDPVLLRQLLVEQVQRGEITDAEAIRCWNIHALPMVRWQRQQGRNAGMARAATPLTAVVPGQPVNGDTYTATVTNRKD
jgi:hypothetical protein